MSDTRFLKDKFKAAPEVTSLASTDRLMVVGSDGGLKKIEHSLGGSKTVYPNKGSWTRIGHTTVSNTSSSILFLVNQGWFNDIPGSALIAASMTASDWNANTNPHVQVLSSVNINLFSKIRILIPSASTTNKVSYIDLLQNSENKTCFISIVGSLNFTPDISTNAEIPTGYTAIERDLASCMLAVNFGGGGKILPFNQLRNQQERRIA